MEDYSCEVCQATEGRTVLVNGKRLCQSCSGAAGEPVAESLLAYALRVGDVELAGILERNASGGKADWHGIDMDAPPRPKKPVGVLDIKPTCACCGMIAGIECQHTCEYLFGPAKVMAALPDSIVFNADKQFPLSIVVATEGRNFGAKKPKTHWFNSVRCAELFLTANGHDYDSKVKTPVGSGERLLLFLGGPEVIKAKAKRSRASSRAKKGIWEGQTPDLARS